MFNKKSYLISGLISAVVAISLVACAQDNDQSQTSGKNNQVQIQTSDAPASVQGSNQNGFVSVSDLMDAMAARQARMMDQMMNDMFYAQAPMSKLSSVYSSYPQSTFTTKKDKYVLEFAVPGIDKKNLSIQIENKRMTIAYKESNESDKKDSNGSESYQKYTSQFQQVVTIPSDVDIEKITSSYKDGILSVTLPRIELPKPPAKTIEIQ